MKKPILATVAAVVLLLAVVLGGWMGMRHVQSSDPAPQGDVRTSGTPSAGSAGASATAAPTAALAPFYGQKLDWTSCRKRDLCADLTVPLDYAHPDGATIEIALLKVPAAGHRLGSLVVNPGGPGEPGTDYAAMAGEQFGKALLDSFDLVGFDPRGTGSSDPITCVSASQMDAMLATDPVPETPAEIATYVHMEDVFGQGCVTRSGPLASHVSTVEAARDMDVLRAALGETTLTYLGASYGTKLGATYADLFPHRVGRFVLDGALDMKLTALDLALGQARGFETALRAYVGHCVAAGSCFLGATVDAGLARIKAFVASVEKHPLPAADRTLRSGNAFLGIILPLYNKDYWTYLDTGLQQAFAGNGRVLMALSDAYASRSTTGYLNNSLQANAAINCLDDPTSYGPAQIEALYPEFEKASPTFGRSFAWMLGSCSGQVAKATEKAPDVDAAGAAPIVVVGTTRDPATPYAWAVKLAQELKSGVLVTRDGDGHTGYNTGNACVNAAVEGYLVKGIVPRNGLRC